MATESISTNGSSRIDADDRDHDPDSDANLEAEIAEAHPDATPLERKLLRAIRPSITLTPDEERELVDRLVTELGT